MYKQLGINLEASSFYESTTQALIGKAKWKNKNWRNHEIHFPNRHVFNPAYFYVLYLCERIT
jgi:hypothetical protein